MSNVQRYKNFEIYENNGKLMTYAVKEIFYSLQGEGAHAGRPAIFCRFTGCNLWSGKEKHRADAICKFCDTDFVGTDGVGGGSFKKAADLAKTIKSYWPQTISDAIHPYVVLVVSHYCSWIML